MATESIKRAAAAAILSAKDAPSFEFVRPRGFRSQRGDVQRRMSRIDNGPGVSSLQLFTAAGSCINSQNAAVKRAYARLQRATLISVCLRAK